MASTETYVPCRCAKCRTQRLAPGTVCPCQECQPGPGIDHLGNRSKKAKARDARMKALLGCPDGELNPAEKQELEELLHWYIHRS